MKRMLAGSLAAPVAALVLLSGCGSADEPDAGSTGGSAESSAPAPSPTGTPSLPGEPPVTSTFDISVPGLADPLLVTRQDHPRGGFQLRVFAAEDGSWKELEVDGHSLVPFVATDVQEQPLSVDCAKGAIVVTRAVAHEPAGIAFAWDVQRTSYAVQGSQVTAGETEEVADNVLPKQLPTTYPGLGKHEAFTSCRS
jgi:hypothetical protein